MTGILQEGLVIMGEVCPATLYHWVLSYGEDSLIRDSPVRLLWERSVRYQPERGCLLYRDRLLVYDREDSPIKERSVPIVMGQVCLLGGLSLLYIMGQVCPKKRMG